MIVRGPKLANKSTKISVKFTFLFTKLDSLKIENR